MIIMGIDPGTALTGYGLILVEGQRLRPVDYGVVRTSSELPLAQRLSLIYAHLDQLISSHRPDVVAVEELFFSRNARSALAVGHARGVALLAAAREGIPVMEYTPLQVKMALTGQGRAAKEQVSYMVKLLLHLQGDIRPDDVTDALAVAITHAHMGPNLELLLSKGEIL